MGVGGANNQSKNQFATRVNINTGRIDQCWQVLKEHVPNALKTKSTWHAGSWQRRYINMFKNMLKVTAAAVRKALIS